MNSTKLKLAFDSSYLDTGLDMKNILDSYRDTAAAALEEAHSLPFAAYSHADVWNMEAEQLFRQEWVFVCCEQELPNSGDYFAFQLAGEALMLMRGKDGQLRALSNNCRHRGTPLFPLGFGQLGNNGKSDKYIVCPYHAWAYETDGALKAAPLVGKVTVDKKSHCLPEFHLQGWHGLLFINLAENPQPLSQRLQGIDEYLSLFNLDRFIAGRSGAVEHWRANWKLAIENAMESYHLFQVHENTLEKTTPTRDAYYIAGCSEWTLTGGKMAKTNNKIMQWLAGKQPEAFDHYVLVSLPPSFVGILTYESFDWLQVLPIDEHNCQIRSGGIAESIKGYDDRSVKAFTDAFFKEDKDICESVQTGMTSQLSSGGKLVEMERIVVDFHQFLANRLFATEPNNFYQAEEAAIFLDDS